MQNDRRQEQFRSNQQQDGYPSGQPVYQSNQNPGYNPYQPNQQSPTPGYNQYAQPTPQPNFTQNPAKSPAAPVEKPEQKKGFLERAKDKVKEYTNKL